LLDFAFFGVLGVYFEVDGRHKEAFKGFVKYFLKHNFTQKAGIFKNILSISGFSEL
jgi:hypothetical protein